MLLLDLTPPEFHAAIRKGNTKKLSDMIKSGVDVNCIVDGVSALAQAVHSGNMDIVRLLLWKDADVDYKNEAGEQTNSMV